MKVGETPAASGVAASQARPVLSGPGWSVVMRGEFYLLRAMPVLTGSAITEVSVTQAQVAALRDGEVTAEQLILGSGLQGRADRVDLTAAGQMAARAELARQSAARPGKTAGKTAGRADSNTADRASAGRFDHRLTAAALVFAAAVFLFIMFGG